MTDVPPPNDSNTPQHEYLAFDRPMTLAEQLELQHRLRNNLIARWLQGEPSPPPPASQMRDAPAELVYGDEEEFARTIRGQAATQTHHTGYLIPSDSPLNDLDYVRGLSEEAFQRQLSQYAYPPRYVYWGDSYFTYPTEGEIPVQFYKAIGIALVVGIITAVLIIGFSQGGF